MKLNEARRLFAPPSRRAILVSAISLVSVFPAAGTALAQETAKAEAAADENSGEIVVTARRREENIQKVPIAITALSQEKLRDNNVTTVGDITHLVPSLSGYTVLDRDSVSVAIRGQTESNGRPGVVMYLNELPVPAYIDAGGGLAGGPGLLFDLENVQVLKGPQGTLFGRESVGGAVVLTTARPKNEFGGHLQFGYGNYNNMEIDGAVDIPLVPDKLLTRFAFNGAKRDGFTHVASSANYPGGIDSDNRDFWSVRGSITFRPNDWFQNDTIITKSHWESHGSVPFLLGVNPAAAAALGAAFNGEGLPHVGFENIPTLFAQQQALGPRNHIPIDGSIGARGDMLAISNATSIELIDSLKLRVILGYINAPSGRAFDLDGTPLPIANQPRIMRVNTLRQFTQEIQLVGKSFGGHLDWTVGAFALTVPFGPYGVQTGTQFGFANDWKSKSRSSSRALYAQGTYELLDGLRFTAGLRYTWDKGTGIGLAPPSGGWGTVCVPIPNEKCTNFVTGKTQSSALTWTLGLDYQVSPKTLIYLASRRGYRAGGGDIRYPYKPEYVLDFELGVKSDWTLAGRPIRVNADVYYQDYTNAQVQRTIQEPNQFITITDNAAGARLYGAELETTWHVTNRLEIGAMFSYLNLKFTKFATGVEAATIEQILLKENRSPKIQYGLNAIYHLLVDPKIGDISVRANWNWQSKTGNTDSFGLGRFSIPSFGLLNLAVNWDNVAGQPLDASLYMSNATDKLYILGGIAARNVIGYDNGFYGEPRMYGARLRYRFGREDHR